MPLESYGKSSRSALFVCSTSLPAPSRAVPTWYCRSRDQPSKACRWMKVHYSNKPGTYEPTAPRSLFTRNRRLFSEGSLSLIILSVTTSLTPSGLQREKTKIAAKKKRGWQHPPLLGCLMICLVIGNQAMHNSRRCTARWAQHALLLVLLRPHALEGW